MTTVWDLVGGEVHVWFYDSDPAKDDPDQTLTGEFDWTDSGSGSNALDRVERRVDVEEGTP